MKTVRHFPHEPGSVPAARHFATSVLHGVPRETIAAVELMVSELATNCIRHTGTGFELAIIHTPQQIRVEATNWAGGTPTVRSPKPSDPSGRGLKIVDMFWAGWGVSPTGAGGKTVWFTVPVAQLPMTGASRSGTAPVGP